MALALDLVKKAAHFNTALTFERKISGLIAMG